MYVYSIVMVVVETVRLIKLRMSLEILMWVDFMNSLGVLADPPIYPSRKLRLSCMVYQEALSYVHIFTFRLSLRSLSRIRPVLCLKF